MVDTRARAYSEIFAILKLMEPQYIQKIPSKLKKVIIHEMDKNYRPNIKLDVALEEQNLCKKTYTILAILNINYWCESTEKKNELIKLYKDNNILKEQEALKKYNPDDIFKTNKQNEEIKQQVTAIVEYKESIFTKIINILKKYLNKKK